VSSEEEWLTGRGQRRVETVDQAYGTLGLDYGKGHLDDLYAAAYDHASRDAWALAAQMMRDRFSDPLPGAQRIEYVVLHEQAKREPGR
jgi:hypothetical protein